MSQEVYVTRRGDGYHSRPDCPRIVSAHKTARTLGYAVFPPEAMSLAAALAWKPVTPCPTCWEV
ncbi:hypothetical protein ACN6LL_004511 [Streptomyces violaceoruber]